MNLMRRGPWWTEGRSPEAAAARWKTAILVTSSSFEIHQFNFCHKIVFGTTLERQDDNSVNSSEI